MEQQRQELPVHQQQAVDMTTTPTRSLTPPAAASATPVVKPAAIVGALNPMEEFVIGILSGIFGAFLSWFQLTGLPFVFYVILMPSLLLEIWESYVLFHKATTISSEIAYAVAHIQAVSRKRLARQLFGQGVIMGSAGFEIIQPDFDLNDALLSRVTYYAVAWLIWIVICHFLNTIPPEDKIAHQVKKQRALARAATAKSKKSNNKHHHHNHRHRHHRRSSPSKTQRIRRTQSGSHASISSILSRSSTSTTTTTRSHRSSTSSSSSFRRSRSIDKTHVPIDLP